MLLDVHLADEAVVLMEAAYEVALDDPETLRLLALARYRLGRCTGWNGDQQANHRDSIPAVRISMNNLALAAMQRGRFAVSWQWVRRGLKRHPGDEHLRRIRLRGVPRDSRPLHQIGLKHACLKRTDDQRLLGGAIRVRQDSHVAGAAVALATLRWSFDVVPSLLRE